MARLTLGHQLARELSRRGNRRTFFSTVRYRELRKIDSVEELAEFFDRNGYGRVRASDNIDEVAGDIVVRRNGPHLVDPVTIGFIAPLIGVLLIPVMLVWRVLWRDDK